MSLNLTPEQEAGYVAIADKAMLDILEICLAAGQQLPTQWPEASAQDNLWAWAMTIMSNTVALALTMNERVGGRSALNALPTANTALAKAIVAMMGRHDDLMTRAGVILSPTQGPAQ